MSQGFLGAYHFDGDVTALLSAYHRLMDAFPAEALDLHVCVARAGGITVYDTCPTRRDFLDFSASEGFSAQVAAAGLPTPRIEELGDVRDVRLRPAARP